MSGIRLSKLMAERGLCSRREADRLIEQGKVLVNGQVVDRLGSRFDPTVCIALTPEIQRERLRLVTVLLNKPPGVVSNQPEKGYPEAASLITRGNLQRLAGQTPREPPSVRTLHVAGRLDIDSSGLLILTQDGQVARQLISPNSQVEKEYVVRLTERVPTAALVQMRGDLTLDGRLLKPVQITQTDDRTLHLVLQEGRKRQIR
ncbi:MAG: pseudouridine synthase, partial [Gammaproteobacteria bacterium]|nr:pseudouridine synthase [Gammaproteobacteria bacterium]